MFQTRRIRRRMVCLTLLSMTLLVVVSQAKNSPNAADAQPGGNAGTGEKDAEDSQKIRANRAEQAAEAESDLGDPGHLGSVRTSEDERNELGLDGAGGGHSQQEDKTDAEEYEDHFDDDYYENYDDYDEDYEDYEDYENDGRFGLDLDDGKTSLSDDDRVSKDEDESQQTHELKSDEYAAQGADTAGDTGDPNNSDDQLPSKNVGSESDGLLEDYVDESHYEEFHAEDLGVADDEDYIEADDDYDYRDEDTVLVLQIDPARIILDRKTQTFSLLVVVHLPESLDQELLVEERVAVTIDGKAATFLIEDNKRYAKVLMDYDPYESEDGKAGADLLLMIDDELRGIGSFKTMFVSRSQNGETDDDPSSDILEEEVDDDLIMADADTEEDVEVAELNQMVDEGERLLVGRQEVGEAMKLFEKAAQRGHSGAILALGSLYLTGLGTKLSRDDRKATELILKAASMGNPDAHGLLGFLYASGWSKEVEADQAKSILYWTIAARGGSIYGQMALGYRYAYGIDVAPTCKKASYTYLKAVEQIIEKFDQDVLRGVPFNDDVRLDDIPGIQWKSEQMEMVQYSKHSAERGEVNALRAVGQFYLFGRGVEQDFGRAHQLFERAADLGDPRAHAFLGFMYYTGVGVEKNNETAFEHFKTAARSREPAGHQGLGVAYRYGAGVEQNYQEAYRNFRQAAEKGVGEAFYNLGVMHLEGLGVEQSNKQAFDHFRQSADRFHLHGLYQTAQMLIGDYDGVEPDCKLAAGQLKQAAEIFYGHTFTTTAFDLFERNDFTGALLRYMQSAQVGVELGQYNTAHMLFNRQGVEDRFSNREDDEALNYFRLSAQQGHVHSAIKVGDILYEKCDDPEAAASVYQRAIDISANIDLKSVAEASFNLGVMHVFGRGRRVDFHLAKRYFDASKAQDEEAIIPAVIALRGLRFYSKWKEYVDLVFDWVVFFRDIADGNVPVTPSFKITAGADEDLTDEVETEQKRLSGVLHVALEYIDLVVLVVLLGTLMLVVFARRRRMVNYSNPPEQRANAVGNPAEGVFEPVVGEGLLQGEGQPGPDPLEEPLPAVDLD